MKVLGKIINILLVVILLLMSYVVVETKIKGQLPTLFKHQVYYVQSGSMEPTLKTGSIILVKKRTDQAILTTGDIITFRMPYNNQILVTHRINEIVKHDGQVYYRTKGDANTVQDPWIVDKNSIVSIYSGVTIPFVGYFFKEIHSSFSIYVLLVILGIILITYGIRLFRKN